MSHSTHPARRRFAAAVSILALAGVGLAACSDDEPDASGGDDTEMTTTTAAEESTTTEAMDADGA